MSAEQLTLDGEVARTYTCCGALVGTLHTPGCPNPNLWMFNEDGSPKRLLWCSDSARRGGPCPYLGGTVPLGECCKDLVRGT